MDSSRPDLFGEGIQCRCTRLPIATRKGWVTRADQHQITLQRVSLYQARRPQLSTELVVWSQKRPGSGGDQDLLVGRRNEPLVGIMG